RRTTLANVPGPGRAYGRVSTQPTLPAGKMAGMMRLFGESGRGARSRPRGSWSLPPGPTHFSRTGQLRQPLGQQRLDGRPRDQPAAVDLRVRQLALAHQLVGRGSADAV